MATVTSCMDFVSFWTTETSISLFYSHTGRSSDYAQSAAGTAHLQAELMCGHLQLHQPGLREQCRPPFSPSVNTR